VQVDWLRSFVAVVDYGGFATAASHTFRAQSRISAHIGSLERELGVRLFDRRSRPVTLTRPGRTYIIHARSVLAQLDMGRNAVAAIHDRNHGHVSVASDPSTAPRFLPRLIHEFGQRHPDIRVELVDDLARVDDAVLAGRIQLALRPMLPSSRNTRLRGVTLWREPMRVVVHPNHPLAAQDEPVPLEDLERF